MLVTRVTRPSPTSTFRVSLPSVHRGLNGADVVTTSASSARGVWWHSGLVRGQHPVNTPYSRGSVFRGVLPPPLPEGSVLGKGGDIGGFGLVRAARQPRELMPVPYPRPFRCHARGTGRSERRTCRPEVSRGVAGRDNSTVTDARPGTSGSASPRRTRPPLQAHPALPVLVPSVAVCVSPVREAVCQAASRRE